MAEAPKPFSRVAEGLIGDLRRIRFSEPDKMRRRPTRDMETVMEELRCKYQIGRSTPEQAIRDRWAELVGPANASYSHPLRVDLGRRLVVQATHSVVRNELFLNREAVIERIQKLPGCSAINGLRIIAG